MMRDIKWFGIYYESRYRKIPPVLADRLTYHYNGADSRALSSHYVLVRDIC